MTKRKGIIAGSILTGLILSLLMIMGCSDLPNRPDNTSTFTIADFEQIATRDSRNNFDAGDLEEGNDGVVVTPGNGGTVSVVFSDGSTATLEVPPDAVDKSENISIEATEIVLRDRAILQFDFQPDGLQFKEDAIFTIDASAFRDADIQYVDWYYYNPDNNKWELVDHYYVVNGAIRIEMPHFSKWMGISQGGQ